MFFHGDINSRDGQTSKSYLTATDESVQRNAEMWSRRLDAPYVFIGRPGTHGSSGDHMQRRRPAESVLISAALDSIKDKLKIKEFVVAM